MCLYEAQIIAILGEGLQDHWSSGFTHIETSQSVGGVKT